MTNRELALLLEDLRNAVGIWRAGVGLVPDDRPRVTPELLARLDRALTEQKARLEH